MGWSYRRRIKVIPGIYLNFSKSGISTSIGKRGASLTFGKSGTYLNTSVLGLGLYNRQKLSGKSDEQASRRFDQPVPDVKPVPLESSLVENVFSLDPEFITTENMQGVKEAINLAHEQRSQLKNDKAMVERALAKSKSSLALSYFLLYGLILRSLTRRIRADIMAQKDAIKQIDKEIENSQLNLDFEFEDSILSEYNSVTESFKSLCYSNYIWDVTASHFQDRVVTRSAASTVINKRAVKFCFKEIDDISANFVPLYFQNANGADLYFFPNFVIVYSTKQNFAIIGLDEIEMSFSQVQFIETDTVPGDSKVVDQTWAKVNKNGSPDRRFKDNYQIPVVLYGNISLLTPSGLHEEYMFSNCESAKQFCNEFLKFQRIIKSL